MSQPRRFTILDGMILIAALAIGLAWVLWDIRFVERYGWSKQGGPILTWLDDRIPLLIAPLSIAVAVARAASSRPIRREAVGEPGFAACATASTLLLATAAVSVLFAAVRGADAWWVLRIYRTYWMPAVGPAVSGAWLFLLAGGLWRPERTWVDRLGRCLGLLWILTRFGPLGHAFWERVPQSLPPPL